MRLLSSNKSSGTGTPVHLKPASPDRRLMLLVDALEAERARCNPLRLSRIRSEIDALEIRRRAIAKERSRHD